jgi:uncharacterized protein YjiS (DUF1127 family)
MQHQEVGMPASKHPILIGQTIMNILRSARNWYAARRTMNELRSLSNATLNDIGITRYDIRLIARRAYR